MCLPVSPSMTRAVKTIEAMARNLCGRVDVLISMRVALED